MTGLRERFEAASRELAASYFAKVIRHNAGRRFYSIEEFWADLSIAADHQDLFPPAL